MTTKEIKRLFRLAKSMDAFIVSISWDNGNEFFEGCINEQSLTDDTLKKQLCQDAWRSEAELPYAKAVELYKKAKALYPSRTIDLWENINGAIDVQNESSEPLSEQQELFIRNYLLGLYDAAKELLK